MSDFYYFVFRLGLTGWMEVNVAKELDREEG
jgi:hypothetical protein